MRSPLVAWMLAVMAVVVFGLLLAVSVLPPPSESVGRQLTGQGQPGPLYDSATAISRADKELPEGAHPLQSSAKLLSYDTLTLWRGSAAYHTNGGAPVWLVGFVVPGILPLDLALATGLVKADSLSSIDPGGQAGNEPADGVYYIFDANSGRRKGGGLLDDDTPQNFETLSGLSSEAIAITPATEEPPWPTDEPGVNPDTD